MEIERTVSYWLIEETEMGNNTNTINELIEIRQDHNEGELVCELSRQASISLLLLDERGQAKLEKKWHPGKTEKLRDGIYKKVFRFPLPELNRGRYNAWIEVGDNTYLRQLHIKHSTASRGGRLKNIFRFGR